MPDRPEWVPRDELGRYWPPLAGRMGELLAMNGRGPPYIIGEGRKAWYRSEDVEAWLRDEPARQAERRAKAIKIPKPRNSNEAPKRRPKKRPTKMSRYLAGQRA